MQIQVECVSMSGGGVEWFMIEMQGDLESRNKDHLEGKFIGDLHFSKQGSKSILNCTKYVYSLNIKPSCFRSPDNDNRSSYPVREGNGAGPTLHGHDQTERNGQYD